MLVPRHCPTVDGETLRSIRRMVDQYLRRFHLPLSDRDDLVQELSLHLLKKVSSYDSSLGAWSTFVKCVVRNKLYSIRRNARDRKTNAPTISLNDKQRNRDGRSSEMADQIPEGSSPQRRFQEIRTVEERLDIQCDVHVVVRMLRIEQQKVCNRLLSEATVEEVAIELSVSKSTVYRRLATMRTPFRECECDLNE